METLEQKIANYIAPNEAKVVLDGGLTVFLVGITGAGKDTILNKLLENNDYHLIISHTTRLPRQNHGVMEVDGVDYHFIDLKESERMVDAHEYVEMKWVHGRVYGTSVVELKKAHLDNKIAISDIEVQGVAEYMKLSTCVTPIFVLPPNFDEWIRRLKSRYNDEPDVDEIKTRLFTARDELTEALNKNYFEFLINDDLDKAVKVANQIAHGDKSFTKNQQAKMVAKNLLDDLNEYLAKL